MHVTIYVMCTVRPSIFCSIYSYLYLFTVLLVYVQVYRTNSIRNTIFMVVLPHFATLMPSICSYFTLWKCNVLELDKVNFKKVIASKELRNCEVARRDGVTFPSERERCDVPSPNTWIERAAQTSIYTHTYSMWIGIWCSKWEDYKRTMLYEHHGPHVCTHRHSYHNMYSGIINFSIPSSSQSSNTHCKCLEPYTAYTYYNSTYLYILYLYILYVYSWIYGVVDIAHTVHHAILAWTSLTYSTHFGRYVHSLSCTGLLTSVHFWGL